MMEKVLITGYKDMCFESGEGDKKQTVDFVKLSLLTKNSGVDAIGYCPTQVTYMDLKKKEVLGSLKDIPGVYEAEYGMMPGKGNKPSLQLIGFTFVKSIDLSSMFK